MTEQISHDIEVLQTKLDNKFEKYPTNDDKEQLDKIIAVVETTANANTYTQYTRYLGQALGRIRCDRIRKQSRKDLFDAHKKYLESQKEAYNDLGDVFSSLGGLFARSGNS